MVALRVRRETEEYNAGLDYCPACGRGRRHLLQVQALRIQVGRWHWDLFRRYRRVCTGCGREEFLPEPPQEWPLPEEEPPAGAEGPGESGAGGTEPPPVPVRGALFGELTRRLDFLLSPFGVRERQSLMQGAAPGVGGMLLEHAGRAARELVRHAVAFPELEVRDPEALERALADLLFAFGWEGYLAYATWMQLHGATPVTVPWPRDPAEFRRRVAPRAYRRAERGRAAAPPELVAWFWDRSLTALPRLQETGQPYPPRLHQALERAARDALYLGYAVAATEGRFGGTGVRTRPPLSVGSQPPGPAAHGRS